MSKSEQASMVATVAPARVAGLALARPPLRWRLSPWWWRLLALPCLMLLISFIAFAALHLTPSDPATVSLRVNMVVPTPEAQALVAQELGLDRPFLIRYADWLQRAVQLDLGYSYLSRRPVLAEFRRALPPTLYLAAVTLLFIVVLALLGAMLCVLGRRTWVDALVRGVVFFLTALPSYWVGLLLIWLLAVRLDWFPVSGMRSPSAVVLPALCLSLAYFGVYLRLLRGSMLAQFNQAYVLYARARGLSERRILVNHILRNALHTAITALSMSIPKLIAGTVVIESIFAWPGIGRLCIEAVFGRDYPMIQAYILLMALLFLTFNFLIEGLQQRLDPRLRHG
ncbi:nickel/cobalt ABC transporter permease [Lampropedia aestuarii]|uniref:nickel/cobalt ABC transporter permease n=1 Tax=Lampropedia aestuarii TaxID=2562762 RepID=UPI002469AF74|nr:nickel/cobalt ABC transporter permease [Lampropedia aestuarii]MDH5856304.1 ABC transporter permease subunit [Lampropedia aestuarii]